MGFEEGVLGRPESSSLGEGGGGGEGGRGGGEEGGGGGGGGGCEGGWISPKVDCS